MSKSRTCIENLSIYLVPWVVSSVEQGMESNAAMHFGVQWVSLRDNKLQALEGIEVLKRIKVCVQSALHHLLSSNQLL